jgi:hypothetical protein
VIDVTQPERMHLVDGARLAIEGAENLYVARTYGYVSAGKRGLVIVDLEHPESPKVDQIVDEGGHIDDLHDVKIGMTNDSLYAYLADGRNGLRILSLVTPEDGGRSAYGFSPRPVPKLIATFATRDPALAISKGLDRDRAVDESGGQVAVFGRIGGRPFRLEESQRLYLRGGEVYKVDRERSPDARDEAPRNPAGPSGRD